MKKENPCSEGRERGSADGIRERDSVGEEESGVGNADEGLKVGKGREVCEVSKGEGQQGLDEVHREGDARRLEGAGRDSTEGKRMACDVDERFARFLNERYWQFDPDLTGAMQEGVDSRMGMSSRVQLSEEEEEQQGDRMGHKGEGGDRGGAVPALGNLPPAGADLN